MKSLLCRRVSWCVERASALMRSFARGEPVCSKPFAAAGIDGLKLLFYPSGYDGAKDGYCSYFVLCPPGTSLHCWLSIGKHRRDARIAFNESEGLFGRTNFCRLIECIEPSTDTITLQFEVEDAVASTTECLEHSSDASKAGAFRVAGEDSVDDAEAPRPGSGPRPQTTNGVLLGSLSGADRGVAAGDALPALTSVFTKQRTNGKAQLTEVQQLPSLWTSSVPCNVGDMLEGFHTFREPRFAAKRPPGRAPLSTPRRREMIYGNPACSANTSKASLGPLACGTSAGNSLDTNGGVHRYQMYT